MAFFDFLDRSHTIAPPNFNRWLFPPAALAVHMCIGQAYALSVFNIPLTRLIGVTKSAPGDWTLDQASYIFMIAFFMLGMSAAFFGKWVEANGPRRTMFTSACCWLIAFLMTAVGVQWHELWLIYLGYGFFGGIALGLGYISPVSTLIKWFPDRPGMATGLAIMGFGGGALIGSPLANDLLKYWGGGIESRGVVNTFITMGLLYFCLMMFGAFLARVPAEGWKPAGWTPSTVQNKAITTANVTADNAIKTPQFWFLWVVLCFNVTAGIGVLAQASPMIQEMFSDAKRGVGLGITSAAAAGFVGLLSLFNLVGRFFWSSISDYTGRRMIYIIYLGLGAVLYALIPTIAASGSVALFVAVFCIILSMYGAGFATVPAYLRDLFGTMQVGAIHGRLLTAWSTAAILGPLLVNNFRSSTIASGKAAGLTEVMAKVSAYSTVMYVMAALLIVGFICNWLIKPVDEKFYFKG